MLLEVISTYPPFSIRRLLFFNKQKFMFTPAGVKLALLQLHVLKYVDGWIYWTFGKSWEGSFVKTMKREQNMNCSQKIVIEWLNMMMSYVGARRTSSIRGKTDQVEAIAFFSDWRDDASEWIRCDICQNGCMTNAWESTRMRRSMCAMCERWHLSQRPTFY